MEFHLIDFIEHALNLLILFLLLRHFLYKPVSKFMAERGAKFAREREQLDASRNEANVLKAQYETSMKNARLDAEHIAEERRKAAEREAEKQKEDAAAEVAEEQIKPKRGLFSRKKVDAVDAAKPADADSAAKSADK